MARVQRAKAVTTLRALADRGRKRLGQSVEDPDFKKWHNDCDAAIRNIFGDSSPHLVKLMNITFSPSIWALRRQSGSQGEALRTKQFRAGIDSAIQLLESFADEVAEFWGDAPEPTREAGRPHESTNVFIIHGRELDFAEVVARFIEKRGLRAIILHEQPNKGRTIIEKFEKHAITCAFAIALFTADDEGGLSGTGELKPRARQNVILETGYFCGALGRDRVAVLCDEHVERPSDFDGLLYIQRAGNAWRESLARELKDLGLLGGTSISVEKA